MLWSLWEACQGVPRATDLRREGSKPFVPLAEKRKIVLERNSVREERENRLGAWEASTKLFGTSVPLLLATAETKL